MTRKIKTVSFSLVSEHDAALLEYAEDEKRGNFSQYVKRLIAHDMKSTQRSIEWNQIAADSGQVPDDDGGVFADVEDTMSGFL
ncbi:MULTISPECIES: hypothetical protein [unclassified Sporosarcina]|uniref:hypothetical protein n=1 Tax=unclassified Sporosarcina TaxID=2647733 RepID=UPI00204187E9|nr:MULTISPECIES: hypothetical protein [unclassified Sporosarcina]GKV67285.1 hypothetical protein NCCP2331_34380 [Sporosarcina sp. NCCP-2331]GLB57654.1 hypothetical protein NCCP2378_34440 [Sporosarcina sp. NCCP-2378]